MACSGCFFDPSCSSDSSGSSYDYSDPVNVSYSSIRLTDVNENGVYENELLNKVPFYVIGKLNVNNPRSTDEKIEIKVIVESAQEIKNDTPNGSVTFQRKSINNEGQGYRLEFNGEYRIAAYQSGEVDFKIKLWRESGDNDMCTGVIQVDCATENVTSPQLSPYNINITINPTRAETLPTPVVTIENDKLILSKIEHAQKYSYSIDDDIWQETDSLYIDTGSIPAGNHTIKVYAVGDGIYYSTSNSYEIAFKKLNSIDVTLNGNVLSWNQVEDCYNYEIISDGFVLGRVNGTSVDISDLNMNGGDKFNVSVRPVVGGKNYVSTPSASTVTIGKLATPVVSVTTKLTWTSVEGAVCYDVYKNGVFFRTVTTNQCSLIGDNYESYYGDSFYVVARGNGQGVVDSKPSNTVISTIG